MIRESNQSTIQHPKINVIENPYFKIKIDCVDHENVQFLDFSRWTASTTPYTWDVPVDRKVVGIHPNQSISDIDFTHTFNLPWTGEYQIEIMVHYHPRHEGGITLYDGSTQIEDFKSLKSNNNYYAYITYKTRKYTSGNHTFKVNLTKNGNIVTFIIRPITTYTGDSEGNVRNHATRLDINGFNFTQNSVAEMNTLNLTLPLREDYYNKSKWYSPLIFDYNDVITLWLGENHNKATTMFGGYITSYTYDDEEIELTCQDRLFDLDRNPLYQNFSIGGAAVPEGSTRPFTPFPSVYELARYLSEVCPYPLKSYLVPHEYAFKVNYANLNDYNLTNTVVWNKYYDHRQGNPSPGLRLSIGEETGNASATLWQTDDPYDSTIYNYLSLDYYAGGSSAQQPLPWNLQVNMHTANETSADAVDYTIQVNGATGTNQIGQHTPTLNGKWQRMTFDLKTLFDKIVKSTNYYINNIKMVGTVTSNELEKRRNSAIWIDNLIGYKEINHAPKYASQDVKTPYEELRQVCERTYHAAFVDYGDNRGDDILVVMPQKHTNSVGVIDEKDNLLKFDGVDYDPLGDDFCNIRHMSFNFDENHAGGTLNADYESVAHYREKHTHDFNSDVNTQSDSDNEVNTYLTEHKWPMIGFSVKCKGTTQLLPEQYATVSMPRRRIIGNYPVKTITHDYSDGIYTTTIDFNKSSHRFKNFIRTQRRENKNMGMRNTNTTESTLASRFIGSSGLGAFTRY